MTLYKLYESCGKIKVKEVEVEEKPKTYKTDRGRFGYSVINKSDIGKLATYGTEMYLLSPDIEAFKQALKKKTLRGIETEESRIRSSERSIEWARKHLIEIDAMEVNAD